MDLLSLACFADPGSSLLVYSDLRSSARDGQLWSHEHLAILPGVINSEILKRVVNGMRPLTGDGNMRPTTLISGREAQDSRGPSLL